MESINEKIFETATRISSPLALAGLFSAIVCFIFLKALNSNGSNKNKRIIIQYTFILSILSIFLGFFGWLYKENNSLSFLVFINRDPAANLTVTALNGNASGNTNRDGFVTLEIYKNKDLKEMSLHFETDNPKLSYDTTLPIINFPDKFHLDSRLFRKSNELGIKKLSFNVYQKGTNEPIEGISVTITNVGVSKTSDRDGLVQIQFNDDLTLDTLDLNFKSNSPKIDYSTRTTLDKFPRLFEIPIVSTSDRTQKNQISFTTTSRSNVVIQRLQIISGLQFSYHSANRIEIGFDEKKYLHYDSKSKVFYVDECPIEITVNGFPCLTLSGRKIPETRESLNKDIVLNLAQARAEEAFVEASSNELKKIKECLR